MEPDFEKIARKLVIPWENFNINAWQQDMGLLARNDLISLISKALRSAYEAGRDSVKTKCICDEINARNCPVHQ